MMTFRSEIASVALALVLTLAIPTTTNAEDALVAPSPVPATAEAGIAQAPAVAKVEISAERLALAKKYLEIVPIESEVREGIAQTAEGIDPEQRVLFRSMADQHVDYARLRLAAEMAAAEVFTEDELKSMIEFFSSERGQQIRSKMPQYQKLVQPVITSVLQDFIKKIQEVDLLNLE